MFDIYKICVFIGLYCFILGFGMFESYRRLKLEGVMGKGTYQIRNIAYTLLSSSVVLLGIGVGIYSTF